MGFLKKIGKGIKKGVKTVGGVIGLGKAPKLGKKARKAEEKERLRLEAEEARRREEARFLAQEGGGIRRQASLSFGARTDNLSSNTLSQRSTGRFDVNRLVL